MYSEGKVHNFRVYHKQGIVVIICQLAFRWGYKFQTVLKKIPSRVVWIDNGSYFVSQPFINRHIGHFAESVNQLVMKLRNPSMYPPLTDWYLPNFRKSEFEWSKVYMRLLISLFPVENRPKMHWHDDIEKKSLVCFRSAVFAARVSYLDSPGSLCVQQRWRTVYWLFLPRYDESGFLSLRQDSGKILESG